MEKNTIEQTHAALIKLFENDNDIFIDTIEELDNYNGYLGDDRYYSMDELPELLSGKDPIDLLNMACFGDDLDGGQNERGIYPPFNPDRDYFRFNGYGNLESTSYIDYSDHLDDYFISALLENKEHLYLHPDVVGLIGE